MAFSPMVLPPHHDVNDPCRTRLLPVPQIVCPSVAFSCHLLKSIPFHQSRPSESGTSMYAAVFCPRSIPLFMFRSLTSASLCPRNGRVHSHAILCMGSPL